MRTGRYMACRENARIKLCRTTVTVVLLSTLAAASQASVTRALQREQPASVPKGLPGVLQKQVQALGSRMQEAGKDETVMEAQLVDDMGIRKAIHVVYQVSGMARIEGLHGRAALTFDGEFTRGIAERMDELLLDTFVMDTPEGMLYSLSNGASMVSLGHDFAPDFRTAGDYKGPRYDIYEVVGPDRLRGKGTLQRRRFYFDSATGLLASTRYSSPSGVTVETRFKDWVQVDGSSYPGTIERYENGRLVFFIAVATVSGQPHRNAAIFQ